MEKRILHITNGSVLSRKLLELDFKGDFLTWEEMLCEGPTFEDIDSEAFFETRKRFFASVYQLELDVNTFKGELNKLQNTNKYSEIILWFEYDLFCHINMLAVISLIQQKKIKSPLYLVCSGRISGNKNLVGLSELSTDQLIKHYQERVLLTHDDINLAKSLWQIYCGYDHNLFKPYIIKTSSFKYLSNCLKAHLERFPDSKSGLNILETNILEIIKNNHIKSEHHLLGYALNYQGYYGFGDLQLQRTIEILSIFFDSSSKGLALNRKGHEALLGQHNFFSEINNTIYYGGAKNADFQFSKSHNKLIKTPKNVH
ncbi:DUF1835 domain-containing protein [Flavobacteriaceae bacterium XHP0103]|uniref:DUF1835 domain-containing protein n=1 Tax=Marixanthotalea marina TaxID=2844359 RepID=UPI002989FD1F|nr:DUF1835 domain-containing protein [Marixanthotalea marina]MBU3822198.1 DUF1835 domain-containing protein [Marixanthotalea marina]